MQRTLPVVAACVLACAAPTRVSAQSAPAAHSPELASELNQLLTARNLEAIAAPDPDTPGRFVAALAYPKTQLLVVEATYPAPALMAQQIAAAKYRDAYLALQQAGVPDGKLFFLDIGYDGLKGGPESVDILYEGATKQTLFDGAPEKHKMSKSDYQKQLADAEASYSRMLTMLIRQLKDTSTQ
jgi:hypothetical protein